MIEFFSIRDRAFSYRKVIGHNAPSNPGFWYPVDIALGADEVGYGLNRGREVRPDGIRVNKWTFNQEFISEFGSFGEGDGQFVLPSAIALDSEEHIYVADEWLSRITVFTKDGEFIRKWGKQGSGDGELSRPSGLAITSEGIVFVVDSHNHRVQKFTLDGEYLGQFGSFGSGPGQLNMPWHMALDKDGMVYVADWRNDRIQKFTPDGEHQLTIGRSGTNIGEFNRPSGVAVDQDGDIYVTDWLNNRVQIFTWKGRFIVELLGDAGISKSGRLKLEASPLGVVQNSLVQDHTVQRRFEHPVAVKVDDQFRIAIVDLNGNRIQVYQKDRRPVLV
jgi:DNA-binding beta-propeller fold protein YncE